MIRRHWPLLLALGFGLALRIALWERLPRLGLIGDEAEYLAAADWLARGRGFAWHTQYLWTRAPLYPLFLAAHIALFGRALEPIFLSQTLLSLVNIALIYLLALRLAGRAAAGIAATLVAVYLPFAVYGQLLLSETLFICLLLGVFVALACFTTEAQKAQSLAAGVWLAVAGVLLGLATLTRGLTLVFVPFVAGWLFWVLWSHVRAGKGWLRRAIVQFCALHGAFCIVLLPWTFYASRTYGGLVMVDSTGAFNLLLGARTAFDGRRDDVSTRNFVLALLPQPGRSEAARLALLAPRPSEGGAIRPGSCLLERDDARLLAALARPAEQLSQGQRQQLMSAEAFCLLRVAPRAFVQKSLTELIGLFQINYTGAERMASGFALGRLPLWYVAALFLLDDTLYVLALPLAVLGWAIVRGDRAQREGDRADTHARSLPPLALLLLIGLWLLFNLAAAPLLFAINRFRVPLMPFVFLLASAALAQLPRLLPTLRTRYGMACAALAGLLFLVAATPYAYLEPRAPGAPARLASYLGPPPSSLALSVRAIAARPGYLAERRLASALGARDVQAARAALADPDLPAWSAAVGLPLLDALEGRPAEGLDRLADSSVRPLEPWQTAVVVGELLRHLDDRAAARRELGPELVDRENPVDWAWEWLAPPPLPENRLTVADDDDLGYISGFYLGGFDAEMPRPDGTQGATTRWASGDAMIRFPRAATGQPQQLCLLASSRGWPPDLAPPTVRVSLDGVELGSFTPTPNLAEHCLALPARPAGADIVIRFVSATFVPSALDLIAQQGPQVGQLRLLAFQLDAAEVR
jgi:4-amino-4-deoxy-L-arabinose transferase-like glycosyltransferase